MTFEELNQFLFIWKARLGLSDWRIELILGGCSDETTYMEVEHSTFYERAVIHVNPWLLGQGPTPEYVLMKEALTDDFIEVSLVHELLHMHTRNIRVVVREDLFGVVSRELHEQLKNAMERADEQMVDRLAEALVKAFNKVNR